MITEQSLKLNPTNCKAKVTFWTLLGLSGVSVVFYLVMTYLSLPKRGLVGLLAIGLITAATLIYTKYLGPVYYYDITHDSDSTPVFVVRQIIGKRQSTLCRIALSDVTEIKTESRKERSAHKTPYTHKKYVYIPTLIPERTVRLTVSSYSEKAEILIEAPDGYVSMLEDYVTEARAIREERDAEERW